MNTVEHTSVNNIITNSLKQAINYQDYRALVQQLVLEESSTGNDKTEALANYTMLNDRRMKRWDKTLKVSEETKEKAFNFKGDVTWLVITESWCGDAAHVIPALNKIAELSPNIDLKLVFRDENEALMDQFLTNGGRAIAKLIMIDNTTGNVLASYGPRPTEATKMVNDYKAAHGQLTPEFKEDLQGWYNKNKGQNVMQDVISLLDL
ncbi:thioredoxin family protein [Psychroserpens damuponensis]|uniref:thioredoxin family protein n=1 Tax=Psychroserpens damuponensis TaxID=943936 RepID=UPI0005917148|nr:thioredoxin family protein [Psychroserpens damuponensis]